ncbi:MAG TPA: cupin domain-containing protein, partial [Nitrolancea sp.]|nr:cupin domain-containing protein [Nitrolancea sp.]
MSAEQKPDCIVVRSDSSYDGKQGFSYFSGISHETAGSTGLCMHMLTIPPGGRAKPHLHEQHETSIYVISGQVGMWYGDGLRQYLTM